MLADICYFECSSIIIATEPTVNLVCVVCGCDFQREMHSSGEGEQVSCENHHGTCAICLSKIVLEEAALVKGCEHAYWFV